MEDSWQVAIGTDPRVALPVPSGQAGPGRTGGEGGADRDPRRGLPRHVDAKTGMLSRDGRKRQAVNPVRP